MHGCMGDQRGGGGSVRARNVLQHGVVEWMREDKTFREGLERERGRRMLDRLLEMANANAAAADGLGLGGAVGASVGYSLEA